MKIIIASTHVPFIKGGGTMIVEDLAQACRERSHEVEIVSFPFLSKWDEMEEQMLALRLYDLSQLGDRLICIRTPSYLLNHPHKSVWFIHHHRGAYDLWGTQYQDIPNSKEGLSVRQFIIDSDNKALRQAEKIYTNSQIVANRLQKYNNLSAGVLYPPLGKADKFHCAEYGDYIFYPSRITHHKRQHLAIESMRHVRSPVKLVIAGSPDQPQDLHLLQDLIDRLKLSKKVKLIGKWISEEEKVSLFANALAGIYIPYDEDSYGYTTLESFYSSKPVITCTDSGGTLEIIENDFNGFVCQPDPKAIAQAMDKLMKNKSNTKQMGCLGYIRLHELGISWDKVVNCLTSRRF